MKELYFYSESSLLAMYTAVLATGYLSLCLSARLSFRNIPLFRLDKYQDTIVRFSASSRAVLVVSKEVEFIGIFAGDHPQ